MASQIIYMRQLLIVFYGNELSISFILAGWLIAGAIGSALLGRFSDLIRHKITAFSLCQIILSVLLPLGVIAARLIKSALHINPGQVLPLFPIMILSFLILAPICAMLGFMFSLACRIYQDHFHSGGENGPAVGIGNVYILEAIGSLAGGALTSLILIRFFDAVNVTMFFSALNVASAFFLILFSAETHIKRFLAPAVLILFFTILSMWPSGAIRSIDKYSLKKEWQGYDLVASKNSIYGNIAIARRGEDFSLFDNGLHLYTVPDRMAAEEATHLALLEHPDPKDVLLIGGGAGGVLEETLKEPVKNIDYVELDPMIIEMTEKYLPAGYYSALKDRRVSIKNTDGRFFVKTTKRKYDCVIIHVGDPYTALTNRYYTAEFFKEVKNILKEGGVVSFALSSSESYISRALREFLSSVYLTVKEVFGTCMVMPGETSVFVASDRTGYLTYDPRALEERTKERALDTQYVREYYLSSRLSSEKVSYINGLMEKSHGIRINRDFKPVSYYYGLIYWATLFRDSAFSGMLKYIDERLVWRLIGAIIILLAVIPLFFRRSFKRTALLAIAAGGFSTMAFQILILLAFQTMYGYLFYKLGIILTAFMAGLAVGAMFAVNIIKKMSRERSFLIAVQGDFLLYSLILPVFFLKSGANFLFPVMSVIAGFIGGSQFPLANRVLLGEKGEAGRTGGLTYGVDLFGSFLGALFTGIILIPILGIIKTCLAIALINLVILALLVLNVRIEE